MFQISSCRSFSFVFLLKANVGFDDQRSCQIRQLTMAVCAIEGRAIVKLKDNPWNHALV
jgi:hypothetical protein